MEESKIAGLEAEIVRLRKLIDILINQNDTLQVVITYLEKGAPVPQVFSSYLKRSVGEKQTWSHPEENEIGENKVFNGSPQNETGREKLFLGGQENETGKEQSFLHSPKTEIGKEQLPKPLPYFIPPVAQNVQALQNSFGAGYWFRVKQDARWAMCQILLQGYNKQDCSYTALGKLTQRSTGGMAKLIASLKKRALIQKQGKSSFILTPLALGYFQKADFNLQPPAHNA